MTKDYNDTKLVILLTIIYANKHSKTHNIRRNIMQRCVFIETIFNVFKCGSTQETEFKTENVDTFNSL